jgi:hypothetical protein
MVSVVGATGGVGATTFAALLARGWAGAAPVTLVDLGGSAGVDVLLGIERAPGARWPALARLRGTLEPGALDGLLPRWRQVEVLSGDRCGPDPGAHAVLAVLDALRAQGRAVVVDLACAALGTEVGDAVVEQLGPGRGELVVLAGQDVLGTAGAVAARARHHGPAHLVLRRRRSGVAPLEAAHVVDLPLLGLLPSDRRIADAVERGLGPQPGHRLRRAVARIAGRLGGGTAGTGGTV